MNFLTGHSANPIIMIHGGAGPMDPSPAGVEAATKSLVRIAEHALKAWTGESRMRLAGLVLEGLENDSGFNAGFGSALQADGVPRLSAAVMDGAMQRFSGVISVTDVKHPSRLALALQARSSRVLTGPGHERLARELHQPVADLVSKKRLAAWLASRQDAFNRDDSCDTVGVALSGTKGALIAGTSTGGRGFEEPGRVSDSATVAGNYASAYAAISVTGIGEQIVDHGVAVRIETRVRDGWSLEKACRAVYDEAAAMHHEYGWIACDADGNWCVAHTTPVMTYLIVTEQMQILASS